MLGPGYWAGRSTQRRREDRLRYVFLGYLSIYPAGLLPTWMLLGSSIGVEGVSGHIPVQLLKGASSTVYPKSSLAQVYRL